MITRVYAPETALWTPDDEASVRQCGQFAAYGANCDFLRFYQDDNGNRLSVCDDTAVLCAKADTEEIRLFLTMDPTIRSVRTDRETARLLSEQWNVPYEHEAVMQAPDNCCLSDITHALELCETYEVLVDGFGQEVLPAYDAWYVDVHHKRRHGRCRIVGVREEGTAVACAMTVAECDEAALIGAVATRFSARGKGYASACVLSLAASLQAESKRVLLSPKNAYAHRLYERIGFTVVGEWGSLKKQ